MIGLRKPSMRISDGAFRAFRPAVPLGPDLTVGRAARPDEARAAPVGVPLVMARREKDDPAREAAAVVSREARQPQPIRLDVAARRTVNHTVHETVIQSLQQSIKTVERELNEARTEWAKPGIDINRLADQMFKEFNQRIRHAQQRRGM